MSKRNLFDELSQSLEEARKHDEGKLTLRSTSVELKQLDITPKEIIRIRESLKLSQALFAAYLHTQKRTYKKWEQGETRPNDQAITLLKLVNIIGAEWSLYFVTTYLKKVRSNL
jgi:putative transcriptional regulator